MLQIFLHIVIISATCITWGLPALLFVRKKYSQKKISPSECFLFLFFSGLLTLAIFSSWLVLFLPLKFGYLLTATTLLLGFIYSFHKKRFREILNSVFQFRFRLSVASSILAFAAFLLFLVIGTVKSVNIDTQMYHLQIVRWTNEYGIVPGLANIYPRLGLGSAWFNLISFFHIPIFKNQNFTYLNCTLVLWFFAWLVFKFEDAGRSEKEPMSFRLFYFLLTIYFFFDWQLFRDTANSTSYDFIVTALLIICISFILETIRRPETNKSIIHAIIILAMCIISFKLSGVFVLLLLIWKLYDSRKIRNWTIAFLTGLIVLSPVLIRNYITTGYPVYPFDFSVNNPDWKMPAEFVQGVKNYIVRQNRYYNTIDLASPNNEFFSLNWVSAWFKGILIQHKLICIAALFSLTFLFLKEKPVDGFKKIKILLFLLFAMALGWFITAPDPRFGYGFLLFLSLLPVSLLIGKHIPAIVYRIATWTLTAGICIYLFQKATDLINNRELLIHTAKTQQPFFHKMNTDNGSLNVTEKVNNNWNNRCFFTPLPCLCENNPYIKFRGNSLKDGFRMIPVIDSNFIKHYNY